MKKTGMKWVVVIAAVSLLCPMSYGEKDKESLGLSAAFKAVVKALFPMASVERVKTEIEGIPVIEIELKDGQKNCSIDLAEDGTVISVETQVSAKGLPAAVAKAIKAKVGDAKISTIEREEIRAVVKLVVLEKPETVYETKFVKDGKEYELKVAASGAVLAMTLAKEEQEEEEDAIEDGGDKGKGKDADDEDEGDDEGDDEGKAVSINDIPKPVKETILKQAKDGKVEEIEKKTEDGKVIYDADIVIDGKKFELKVAENGKLLSKEADEDQDKDGDKDKEDQNGEDEKGGDKDGDKNNDKDGK